MSTPKNATLPADLEAGPFSEPWQARIFAITVDLNERGIFSWSEWAEIFSPVILQNDAAEDASDYYHRWSEALIILLDRKGLLTDAMLDALTQSWKRAANATPHGKPILRENDPLFVAVQAT